MCLKKILSYLFGAGDKPPDPVAAGSIRHVILLMFENHSFDQMLGCFKAVYPGLKGVDPAKPRSNKDSTGRDYFQRESNDTVISPDPKHELAHILNQLKDGNSGFVSEYEKEYAATATPTTEPERQHIMDYFGMEALPALHALAKHFTICDQWYSSVPGPTWTNRFFAYSGTSMGLVEMPTSVLQTDLFLQYTQDTIFDRLHERGVPWRVYFGDVPNSLVLRHQWDHALHYHLMHEFWADVAGPEPAFPAFTLIEPNYMYGEQNDDHPPHSTMRAQRLLGHVYNELRRNEPLWNSTLLVIVYDEHGGFYDQEIPQDAVPPDAHQEQCAFDRFGVRVPALLVSPWVRRGVFSERLDHTSLLRYVIDRWQLSELTARVRAATSIAGAIQSSARTDTPESVPVPELEMMSAADGPELAAPLNEHQKALLAFSEHLAEHTVVRPAAPEITAMAAGPVGQAQTAKARVLAFLEQQKAAAVATP